MVNNARYKRALKRNLYEARNALSSMNAYNRITNLKRKTSWSFFTWAIMALKNDMYRLTILILDEHRDSASFWYLFRCKEKEICNYLNTTKNSLDDLKKLSSKFNQVRDKTFFHIDRDAVFNPDRVWQHADIKGDFYIRTMYSLWDILRHLYKTEHNDDFPEFLYDGDDVDKIIEAVKTAGIKI
jgi:hypothetical protein